MIKKLTEGGLEDNTINKIVDIIHNQMRSSIFREGVEDLVVEDLGLDYERAEYLVEEALELIIKGWGESKVVEEREENTR